MQVGLGRGEARLRCRNTPCAPVDASKARAASRDSLARSGCAPFACGPLSGSLGASKERGTVTRNLANAPDMISSVATALDCDPRALGQPIYTALAWDASLDIRSFDSRVTPVGGTSRRVPRVRRSAETASPNSSTAWAAVAWRGAVWIEAVPTARSWTTPRPRPALAPPVPRPHPDRTVIERACELDFTLGPWSVHLLNSKAELRPGEHRGNVSSAQFLSTSKQDRIAAPPADRGRPCRPTGHRRPTAA